MLWKMRNEKYICALRCHLDDASHQQLVHAGTAGQHAQVPNDGVLEKKKTKKVKETRKSRKKDGARGREKGSKAYVFGHRHHELFELCEQLWCKLTCKEGYHQGDVKR